MELNGSTGNVNKLSLIAILCLTSSLSHAAPLEPVAAYQTNVYLSIFGGWGKSNNIDLRQYATAFYPDILGGPVAINAFGHTNRRSVGYFGANLGYLWNDISLVPNWHIAPAFELEGYYFGKKSFHGELINDTVRLPEHDFLVDYPMYTSVFMTNAVINFGNPCLCGFRPYIGAGIGGVFLSVNSADAFQIAPPEVGLNHYNAKPKDRRSAFAAQIKLGLTYEVMPHFSVFAEYKWLTIAGTDFTFGSTIAAGHFETSPWNVRFNPQRYNMGDIGIRYQF